MANRKSMRGVEVDIAKLMARQEKNITVGNTKSNARGDQLGRGGRIVKSADELAREHYNRNDPKAVVHGGIKVDDEIPNVPVQEVEKPKDDWVEPIPTPTPAAIPQPKPAETSPEPTPPPAPKPQPSQEEDPWVEDKDGNFVRQSELHQQEQNERVSKPKANQQSQKTSNKKKK